MNRNRHLLGRNAIRCTAILLAVLLAGPVFAAGGASSAINEPFLDPDFSTWVERFERPGREVYDRRDQIVAATGVRPGMAVADVGAGTGLFSLLYARAVGREGRVYAVDISTTFIDNILRRARAENHDNIIGVVNMQSDVKLAPATIDLAFICDTYHHFEQPAAMMDSIRRALRPGGRVVIVDFRRVPGESSDWVMRHVRAGQEQVIKEMEQSGFRYLGAKEILKTNYFLEFQRP